MYMILCKLFGHRWKYVGVDIRPIQSLHETSLGYDKKRHQKYSIRVIYQCRLCGVTCLDSHGSYSALGLNEKIIHFRDDKTTGRIYRAWDKYKTDRGDIT